MKLHQEAHLFARFRLHFWLLVVVWTGCIAGSLLWNLHQQANHSLQMARSAAQITFENDVLYRRWAAKQGGVYVRVSADLPPNPYLKIPNRDVTTTSGVPLTLVNPAYMARQVNALAGATGGSRGHLTSLNPLRPDNAPDPWEAAALKSFEEGAAEVSSVAQMAGGEYLRLMRPFVVEPACLNCHAAQGYKEGDIRGGVSVSVPMTSLRAIEKPMTTRLALAHLGLWMIGLAGMAVFRRSLGKEIAARERAETEHEKFVMLADQSTEFIGICDMNFQPFYVNEAGMRLVGLDGLEQACATPVKEFFFPADQRFIYEEFFPRVLREGRAEVEIRFRHFKTGEALWMIHHVFCIRDADGKPAGLATVSRDITERKRREQQLAKLTRMYAVLSRVNEAIVRTRDAESLYAEVCRIVAEEGGVPLVWIGVASEGRIVPRAWCGPAADYAKEIRVEVQGDLGRGPTGTCIRENRPVVNDDFEVNPATAPWRGAALRYGFRASAAFPLRRWGQPVGVLTIYASDPGAFDADQVGLLEALGADVSFALDALEHEQVRLRSEQALRESEEQFHTLADSIPNLAWWANGDGYITWYNRRWYEYTGTTAAQMEGWGWQSVHDPNELPRVLERWQASLATGEPFHMEFPLRGRDGQFRWFLTRVLPLKDASGRVVRWFGTNTDVTEVRLARQAAEAANVAKSQFLANMSHELRTPMNAIMGMLDLALRENLPPALCDYLQTARQSADGLLELLNEILDLARIEAGAFHLEAVPFDLGKTVEQVVKTLRVRAAEKGLQLRCELGGTPPHLVGDPLRLRQVLMNLVGNAIKFTAEGVVVVEVGGLGVGDWGLERSEERGFRGWGSEPQRQGADAESRTLNPEPSAPNPQPPTPSPASLTLQFAISDTGIGIAAEDLDRIFAPFTQADASTTRQYGGTGLGLTITRRLVDLMGGRIWAESEPGRGSTFHFTACFGLQADGDGEPEPAAAGQDAPRELPIATVAEDRGRRTIAAAPARPLRVLLAEDTRANQKVVTYVLSHRGHCVEVAENGQQALEALARQPFDVVLMDVQMPVMDGFAATAAIRKAEQGLGVRGRELERTNPEPSSPTPIPQPPTPFRRLPIIAMTAHALKGDAERCLAAGMDAYISKPVKADELIELVERLAEQRALGVGDWGLESGDGGNGQTPTPNPQPLIPTPQPPTPVFNLDEAVSKCYGRYHLFQDFVAFLFQEAGPLLERMRSALTTGEAAELGAAAHRLKGTVAYLGAPPAWDATHRVEQMGNSGELVGAAEAIDRLARELAILQEALAPHRKP